MRQYVPPALVVAMPNAVPVQICRRRLGEALPAALFCVPVALFASQLLFRTFAVGTVALCVAATSGTAAALLRKT